MKTLNYILTFLTFFLALFLVVAALYRGDMTTALCFTFVSAPLALIFFFTRGGAKKR